MILRQDRRQIGAEAVAAIGRQVEIAARDLALAARRHGEVRFIARPSQRAIADAAKARTPSESQVHIANATMRRLAVHVTPDDCPDVTALLDEGAVTWSRGRIGPLEPHRGEPLKRTPAGLSASARLHRGAPLSERDIRTVDGKPARIDDLLAWSAAVAATRRA